MKVAASTNGKRSLTKKFASHIPWAVDGASRADEFRICGLQGQTRNCPECRHHPLQIFSTTLSNWNVRQCLKLSKICLESHRNPAETHLFALSLLAPDLMLQMNGKSRFGLNFAFSVKHKTRNSYYLHFLCQSADNPDIRAAYLIDPVDQTESRDCPSAMEASFCCKVCVF